jgi:hypothetical protein
MSGALFLNDRPHSSYSQCDGGNRRRHRQIPFRRLSVLGKLCPDPFLEICWGFLRDAQYRRKSQLAQDLHQSALAVNRPLSVGENHRLPLRKIFRNEGHGQLISVMIPDQNPCGGGTHLIVSATALRIERKIAQSSGIYDPLRGPRKTNTFFHTTTNR